MAHPDQTLASLQKRCTVQQPVPIHPADSKAIVAQIKSFQDAALGRKLTYAAQQSISVALSDTETASLLNEIKLNGG